MIYVDLKGNVGNQLFTYACARELQKRTGQKIVVNTFFLKKYKPQYECNLQNYKLNENVIFDEKNKLPWFVNTYSGLMKIFRKIFPTLCFYFMSLFGVIIWLGEDYKKLPFFKRKNYYLVGYFQSTKYFSNIEKELLEEFKPKFPSLPENKNLYQIIGDTESICVTIRRGDYVSNEIYKKKFFLCDVDFFLEGIMKIKNEIPHATVICFSDEIDWVKEHIKLDGVVYYESGNDPVWEKLRLMSCCKHFVISNSSFSWWAQHLSCNDKKIVYAPSKWYPNNEKCDIYEYYWRYIEVKKGD